MVYTEAQAKELVVEAGKKLVETGLIARTWGNVSARLSDTQFVITPSGRAYETLTPDDIVVVNIDDCSYEGSIKPSSEKGIHADAYKLRPNVNFVIHTHQVNASVLGATGLDIDIVPDEYKEFLGEYIPVADYGMPSTDKLRSAVRQAYTDFPKSNAVMLKHHGAVCLGESFDEAFSIADSLEKVCGQKLKKAYKLYNGCAQYSKKDMLKSFVKNSGTGKMPAYVTDFGESERFSTTFELKFKSGKSFTVDVETGTSSSDEPLPAAAKIHCEIYKNTNATCIKHLCSSEIVACSVSGKPIHPRLDDFAQIAGAKIKSFNWDGSVKSAKGAVHALGSNNAVLIAGAGALCTGTSKSDLDAVQLVMSKECMTQIGSVMFGSGTTLSPLDCLLMRTIYVTKYSKKAAK